MWLKSWRKLPPPISEDSPGVSLDLGERQTAEDTAIFVSHQMCGNQQVMAIRTSLCHHGGDDVVYTVLLIGKVLNLPKLHPEDINPIDIADELLFLRAPWDDIHRSKSLDDNNVAFDSVTPTLRIEATIAPVQQLDRVGSEIDDLTHSSIIIYLLKKFNDD